MKFNKKQTIAIILFFILLGSIAVASTLWTEYVHFQHQLDSIWEIWATDNVALFSVSQHSTQSAKVSEQEMRNKIVWQIYGLESTWGRNDGCKQTGKFNGFGFNQHKSSWKCFDTFEAASQAVHSWVASMREQGHDWPTLLCYYNTGHLVNNCRYYQKSLTLN